MTEPHAGPLRPQDIEISADVLKLVNRATAQQFGVCPLSTTWGAAGKSTLVLASSEPTSRQLIDELRRITGYDIKLVPASPQDILRGIEMHYPPDMPTQPTDLLSQLNTNESARVMQSAQSAPQEFSKARAKVEDILQRAMSERATDIHLQPDEKTIYVRYRTDGVMFDSMTYEPEQHAQIVSRIKILSNLDIAQNRLPQDGRFEVGFGKWLYDVRVSVVPLTFGEKVVMRLLPKSQLALDLGHMGFTEHQRALLDELVRKPYGMLLATGPTGAGKTTTVYALLSKVDCVTRNVITVEDPIEYQLPHVSQIQVHPKIGLTFAAGLRAILRQDPDVIMVGEIRDPETLEMAVQSALTGHLVLSTLHCNDAAAAAARMVDMGEEPFLIASSISGILAQRLVRRICQKCKTAQSLNDTVREKLCLPDDDTVYYTGAGCEHCRNTGYVGRIGIFEVVPMHEKIQEAVVRKASAAEIRHVIRELHYPTLRDDGMAKVRAGITSLEEFVRAVYEDF